MCIVDRPTEDRMPIRRDARHCQGKSSPCADPYPLHAILIHHARLPARVQLRGEHEGVVGLVKLKVSCEGCAQPKITCSVFHNRTKIIAVPRIMKCECLERS